MALRNFKLGILLLIFVPEKYLGVWNEFLANSLMVLGSPTREQLLSSSKDSFSGVLIVGEKLLANFLQLISFSSSSFNMVRLWHCHANQQMILLDQGAHVTLGGRQNN